MRIAAVQLAPVFDDPDRAIAAIGREVARADIADVGVALFPEAYLQGHSYDAAAIERRAIALDDPIVHRLTAALSGARATAIVGFFERRGTAILNSAMVIEGGRLVGTYAKAFPLEAGCTPGDSFPVWHRDGWCYGLTICNDTNYPEVVAARLMRQGAALLCCPLNMMLRPKKAERWRRLALESLQAYARATGCWVMAADVVGPDGHGWLSYGCTAILRPDGTLAARAPEGAADVAMVDLP